jgi:hypothetical protein
VADKVLPLSAPELTVFPAFRLAALLLFMLESLEFCLSMRDVRAGRPLRRSQMASMSQMICMKGRTSTRMFMAKTKKSANESPPPPPEPPVEYALGDIFIKPRKSVRQVITREKICSLARRLFTRGWYHITARRKENVRKKARATWMAVPR